MKVEISNMDNGSGMNTKLFIKSDYNPQNKIFNKNFGIIEEDDFIECFPIKNQNRVIENMSEGKFIFDINKSILQDKCKQLF